jgi:hypothetical protein
MNDTNGKTSLAAKIATDPALIAVTRLVQLVVLPVGAWLFLQVWNGLAEIRTTLHAIDTRLAVQEQRARTADRDLGMFNARLFALERAARVPEIQPSIVVPPTTAR